MSTLTSAAQLATAGGTLVLAVATFQSVRSANRSTRIAEESMAMRLQPVLINSRPEDPPERVTFLEGVVMEAAGGTALVEEHDGNLFIVIPLRNVGPGLAVLRAGHVALTDPGVRDLPTDPYRQLNRDLYVPPGDRGFWQIGIRDADDPFRPAVEQAIRERRRLTVTILYTDHVGGHRAKTQFTLAPQDDGVWHCSVTRHIGIAD
jgi:hypothetical protein